jgi:hypothetical protein
MTDRELLEDAAKAAGKEHYGEYNAHAGLKTTGGWWNPLTDDGDALRLAVKLRLMDEVSVMDAQYESEDPLAATRLAIVRAAAEIGRNMT